jgi:YidC/Oxa1 family membrane protein insertase
MDTKRLLTAFVLSFAIMAAFSFIQEKYFPQPQQPPQQAAQVQQQAGPAVAPGALPAAVAAPAGPVLKIDAPLMQGGIALTGAKINDIVLTAYHETVAPNSPLVQVLDRANDPTPTKSYVQFGWSAGAGVNVPTDATVWTASAPVLTPATPVTLSWDNGQGLTFQIQLAVDDKYMFTVAQSVTNHTGAAVQVYPWSRVVREHKPLEQGNMAAFDGPLGVFSGTLKQESYGDLKSDGKRAADGVAYTEADKGGWSGITDKYWLTAVIPDQTAALTGTMSYGGGNDSYQTAFITTSPLTVLPGATSVFTSRAFTGAKVVKMLDAYQDEYNIPNFYKAVDFGHLYFLTKPIFFALDWLNGLTGNFGVAILIFTVGVKLVFFPLASYSYRSMGRMRLLQPKIVALKEQFKDDNVALQQATMELYKTEKINPASGCLPMLLQIPVFFSLYKVILITIEMRQTPFYGWIRDLSSPDPTNLFNAFGLIPFDPTVISPMLHMGLLPIIMGLTMFAQQKLNPAPADPVQARMFQFMPIIFTFMLARSPAGLVLYWAWNNILSVGQQWLIMRSVKLPVPVTAKA